MKFPGRALAALLVILIASLAGAYVLERGRAARGADTSMTTSSRNGVASLELPDIFAQGPALDQRLLNASFLKVRSVYYKPVDDAALLTGERAGLAAWLHAHGVTDPVLPDAAATGDATQDQQTLDAVLQGAIGRYGKRFSDTVLMQQAIKGMLAGLKDPYTTYLTPDEISQLEESLNGGDFGGIGVYIVQDPRTGLVLVQPIEGTPAARAGIKTGDSIIAVDGKPTKGETLDTVEREIRGRTGTVVRLLVRSQGERSPHTVAVVRERIHVPSVHAKVEGNIGYIRLSDFGSTSYEEVRHAVDSTRRGGAKAFILDLRNNGGGLLDAAVDISSIWIKQGTIVSTVDRPGDREVHQATGQYDLAEPLVVLVNKYTASASEITAGAIQDDHAGTVLGTRTFGKGVVQSIYRLPDLSALKITTARYLTPSGRDIDHKGIEPDIVVDQSVDPALIDTPNDRQLAAAKALLERDLASR
ncbi:MAG TPA: S41 family peptidase [Candidatus Dormibacteraeota bacterium]|nr:S41 family peptidase [Candidatus Dormibacteraeota bacterium]